MLMRLVSCSWNCAFYYFRLNPGMLDWPYILSDRNGSSVDIHERHAQSKQDHLSLENIVLQARNKKPPKLEVIFYDK
jgi:hypothetical protein